ncbi:hypothetical protein M8C21_028679, partial [Ambrosia artemisiifolia]
IGSSTVELRLNREPICGDSRQRNAGDEVEDKRHATTVTDSEVEKSDIRNGREDQRRANGESEDPLHVSEGTNDSACETTTGLLIGTDVGKYDLAKDCVDDDDAKDNT